MSLFGLKGKIVKSTRSHVTSSVLQTVWIRILEVPDIARDVEIVREMAALVAEPIMIDELSLIRARPVRFQGRCRNPSAIHGYIEFFFNGEGIKLKFEVEDNLGTGKGGKGGPPGAGRPDDSHNKDKGDDHRGDRGKKSVGKFDMMGRLDKEMDSTHDDSMEENVEGVGIQKPIAAFHPAVGIINVSNVGETKIVVENTENSSLQVQEDGTMTDEMEEELVPNEHQIVVHSLEGKYLMEKNNWPTLKLPNVDDKLEGDPLGVLSQEESLLLHKEVNERENNLSMFFENCSEQPQSSPSMVGEEEDLMDNISFHSKDSDMEDNGQGWKTSKAKKARRPKKKCVIGATRTSSRIPRDGIPIITKATDRAKARDDFQGIKSQNPFTILNSVPISALKVVMDDLDIESNDIEEQISAFRAEEIARAAIAEANYKAYLEKQKSFEAPGDKEDTEHISLEKISNQNRALDTDPTGGEVTVKGWS